MKGKLNTDLGQVLISPEVVAKYASETAYECFGIVGNGKHERWSCKTS